VEADSAQRNLGVVVINGQKYSDARTVETYTDGHTKVEHAGGTMVVRTDALPEIVRMQLSIPIANPTPMPSAIPQRESSTTTVVVPTEPVRPAPPKPTPVPSPPRTTTYHYWRPN
jgi:hypothetical protein